MFCEEVPNFVGISMNEQLKRCQAPSLCYQLFLHLSVAGHDIMMTVTAREDDQGSVRSIFVKALLKLVLNLVNFQRRQRCECAQPCQMALLANYAGQSYAF